MVDPISRWDEWRKMLTDKRGQIKTGDKGEDRGGK